MSRLVNLTGNDVIEINGQAVQDSPFGDIGKVTFDTDIVNTKVGKNGNMVAAFNTMGRAATLELRVLRGGADDIRFNELINNFFAYAEEGKAYTFINGSFTKVISTAQIDVAGGGNAVSGANINEKYDLQLGIISKFPDVLGNVEGDVEQGVATYIFKFAYAARTVT